MIDDSSLADNQEPGQNVKWASKGALAAMGKTERFEHTMPFHTLRVDIFEGNVKRFVHGTNFVTLKQLRFAFKHRPFFQQHLPFIRLDRPTCSGDTDELDDEDPDGSCMTRLITDEMLLYKMNEREAENEQGNTFGQIKIDIFKLITLGVILCWGTDELKSRVLYNAIQTHIQEFIVPNQRMDEVIGSVIRFSTLLMMRHTCRENKEPDYSKAEIPLHEIDDDLIEQVKESWLESVFGTESKMERTLFLKKILQPESKWILNSESVRKRVVRTMRANGQGVHVLDKMADSPSKVKLQPKKANTIATRKMIVNLTTEGDDSDDS